MMNAELVIKEITSGAEVKKFKKGIKMEYFLTNWRKTSLKTKFS